MTAAVASTSSPLAGAAEVFRRDMDLTVVSRNPTRLSDATIDIVRGITIPCIELDSPRASIILVTHNNLAFTRLCLGALLGHAERNDFEIIIVDNASTDGTVEFLRSLSPTITLIANEANRGFPAANNQALATARGEFLILLNNDTIVPRGWLERLVDHLRNDPSIGSVCACTNRIGNEAEIDTSYRTFGEFCDFAQRRMRELAGATFDLPMAPMFCMAMRREVLEKVGPLDEQFGAGMFEDDDYAMRVRAAGYRVCCADDVFVHHFGGASFGNLIASGEHGKLFRANRELFEKKWGVTWRSHGGRRKPDYDQLLDAIRAAVAAMIPKGSTIAVINKGDEQLLKLEGMRGWHFPRQEDGQYSGHYPADGAAAVAHLEALRENGAEYLLIPRTSAWWLDHYPPLAQHLDQTCSRVKIDSDCCLIFDLSRRDLKNEQPQETWQQRHIRELCAALLPAGAKVVVIESTRTKVDDADFVVIPADRLEWLGQRDDVKGRLIADRRHVGRIYEIVR